MTVQFNRGTYGPFGDDDARLRTTDHNQVWNPSSLAWEAETQPLIDATGSNLYIAVAGVESRLDVQNSLVAAIYDNIAFTYDGSGNPLTKVYKKGAVTVSTLTFGYDGSGNIVSVTKT